MPRPDLKISSGSDIIYAEAIHGSRTADGLMWCRDRRVTSALFTRRLAGSARGLNDLLGRQLKNAASIRDPWSAADAGIQVSNFPERERSWIFQAFQLYFSRSGELLSFAMGQARRPRAAKVHSRKSPKPLEG
jgi:hypothetical protein